MRHEVPRTHYNYTHEVESPIGARTQSVCGGSDSQRYDLSRIKPCHAQPTDGKEGIEQKQEQCSYDTGTFTANAGHSCQTKKVSVVKNLKG